MQGRASPPVSADRFPDFTESRPPVAASKIEPASQAPGQLHGQAPSGALPPIEVSAEPSQPSDLTWRDAVTRLNQLGIRQFKLEPGARDGFHFSCYFTPQDNPRITHRFEAEATEPLRAVENVLSQVETWLRGQ
jgi:hypothetical protein